MRKSFYPKMAWSGISHNRKLYIPYFFTCIAMVMMFYIIDALSVSNVLVQIRGGETMQGMLNLGKWIIGLFTLIFLFYTNSFLINGEAENMVCTMSLVWINAIWHIFISGKRLLLQVFPLQRGLYSGLFFQNLQNCGW